MFNLKLFNLIDIQLENPIKTWWKAKKYFKRPNIKFEFTKINSLFNREFKLLTITSQDVSYKYKYDEINFELPPYLSIKLFNKFKILIYFNIKYKDEFGIAQDGNYFYWEYLLDWLYKENKESLMCFQTWKYDSKLYTNTLFIDYEDESKNEVEPMEMVIPVIEFSLNKKGLLKLREEIKLKNQYRFPLKKKTIDNKGTIIFNTELNNG